MFIVGLKILLIVFCLTEHAMSQETDVPNGNTTTTVNDDNNEYTVFSNYNALRDNGQGFFMKEGTGIFETPGKPAVPLDFFYWFSDLDFSSTDDRGKGYVGRGIQWYLRSSLEDLIASGAQAVHAAKGLIPFSLSAVYIPQLRIFEGQFHSTADDFVIRFWDNGSSTFQLLGWEGHDEGDTSLNARSSTWSGFGILTPITLEVAAAYVGVNTTDLTPATFEVMYKKVWDQIHEKEDPINVTITTIGKDIDQLEAENEELKKTIAAIKEALEINATIDESLSSIFLLWLVATVSILLW